MELLGAWVEPTASLCDPLLGGSSGLSKYGNYYNRAIMGYIGLGLRVEGQGDFVSRIITSITHTVTRIILIINLLTKSP